MKIKFMYAFTFFILPLIAVVVFLSWIVIGLWDGIKLTANYMKQEWELSWPSVKEFYKEGYAGYKRDYLNNDLD